MCCTCMYTQVLAGGHGPLPPCALPQVKKEHRLTTTGPGAYIKAVRAGGRGTHTAESHVPSQSGHHHHQRESGLHRRCNISHYQQQQQQQQQQRQQ